MMEKERTTTPALPGFTVSEAAAYLGLTRDAVWKRIYKGTMKREKDILGHTRIPYSELIIALNEQRGE
jgi:excisionase family DNA binding protein